MLVNAQEDFEVLGVRIEPELSEEGSSEANLLNSGHTSRKIFQSSFGREVIHDH
jgi:hypothetical protein